MTFRLEIEYAKGRFYRKGDRLHSVVGVSDEAEARADVAKSLAAGLDIKVARIRDWDADMLWVRKGGERPEAKIIYSA